MIPAICCVPCSPLREAQSHKTEMVSQLLFGEYCEILDHSQDQWIRVRSKYDGYEGWCQNSHIVEIDKEKYGDEKQALTVKWITEIRFNGDLMKVPFGSMLGTLKKGRVFWKEDCIEYDDKLWNPVKAKKSEKNIKGLAFTFLNTPYLWGGKTVFGADCSGYTQTVFRFLNIHLHRDAWQQANQGEVIDSLRHAKCGDLAFFDNDEERIVHVGILLDKHSVIHASGKVRVDKIDSEGIIHSETGLRTHRLKLIKNYF